MDTRPRITLRSYEDFQPTFQWAEEEGFEILHVSLPGFKKEQIKVQIDNFGNIRVSGERPLGGTKWSRFRRDFRIPHNCNASQIRAKFENELLSVTFPKYISKGRPQEQPKEAKEPPASQKVADEPKAREELASARQTSKDAIMSSKLNGTVEKQTISGMASQPSKLGETTDASKDEQKVQEKEKDRAAVLEDTKKATNEIGKKGSETADSAKGEPAAEYLASGDGGISGLEKLKYRVGRLSLGVEKPRQLMLNVAAAFIVLVGLALYVAYKMRTSIEADRI